MIAISGSFHHYERLTVTQRKNKNMGVRGDGCVNQDPEEPNAFVASSERLLNSTHLRFDSMNLALWSQEVVTHKQ